MACLILRKKIFRVEEHKFILGWKILLIRALFSSPQKPKKIQDSLSHRILRHMHEVLNRQKQKLIAQFACKS